MKSRQWKRSSPRQKIVPCHVINPEDVSELNRGRNPHDLSEPLSTKKPKFSERIPQQGDSMRMFIRILKICRDAIKNDFSAMARFRREQEQKAMASAMRQAGVE